MVMWVVSDRRLRTDDEILDAVIAERGFRRRGPRIVEAVNAATGRADVTTRCAWRAGMDGD
jgi:hypothetical protein